MTSTRWLIAILFLAVLLRVGVALYLGDSTPPGKDETSYATLGARLTTGHGYSFPRAWYPFSPADTPTAHWSFLYTGLIAAVYAVAGAHPLAVRLLQALLTGLLLPWLTWRLSQRVFPAAGPGQEAAGAPFTVHHLAALLAAGYGYFVLYGAMVQTEGLFIVALLWSLERALVVRAEGGKKTPRITQIERMARTFSGHQSRFIRSIRSIRVIRGVLPPSSTTFPLWRLALTLGLSLGIATLLRQSILPWVPVLFVWLLASEFTQRRKELVTAQAGKAHGYVAVRPGQELTPRMARIARMNTNSLEPVKSSDPWPKSVPFALLLSALVLVACIAPFTLRNYRVYGEFLLLNSNAGYAMYSAQHPLHGTDFQAYAAAPLPEDLDPMPQNEAQWDRALMARGLQFVMAEPGRYLLLSLSRVWDYLEFWPKEDSSLLFNLGRLLSFTLLLPFMAYGVWVVLRRARAAGVARPAWLASPPALLLLFVGFYSLLHIFTWAMPRYRLPVDAVLLVFAAQGLWVLGRGFGPRITRMFMDRFW